MLSLVPWGRMSGPEDPQSWQQRRRCPALVRPARRSDTDEITGLWQAMMSLHRALDPRFKFDADAASAFRQHVRSAMRNREMCVYVAELGGRIVGYVLAHTTPRPPIYPVGRYGFISDLYVMEPYRRQGIGQTLLQYAVKWLASLGVTAVELLAAERNEQGRAFWEAMGFRPFLVMYRLDMVAASGDAPDRERFSPE